MDEEIVFLKIIDSMIRGQSKVQIKKEMYRFDSFLIQQTDRWKKGLFIYLIIGISGMIAIYTFPILPFRNFFNGLFVFIPYFFGLWLMKRQFFAEWTRHLIKEKSQQSCRDL